MTSTPNDHEGTQDVVTVGPETFHEDAPRQWECDEGVAICGVDPP
jgi:hypothetical protein